MDSYILKDKTPIKEPDINKWARWFTNNSRKVADDRDKKTKVHVSTVFLGINHNFNPDSAPQVFETMIFGGEHHQEQYRYSTWDEALAGHKKACEKAGVTEL